MQVLRTNVQIFHQFNLMGKGIPTGKAEKWLKTQRDSNLSFSCISLKSSNHVKIALLLYQ